MEANKSCPLCGCKEIGEGKFEGYAELIPVKHNKFFTAGSPVIAEVCTKCGNILTLRVTIPDKFR